MALTEEERQLLSESLRRFSAEHHPKLSIRAASGGPDREKWKFFAELGWLGVGFPSELGGAGGTLRDQCLIMECAGRALIREPLLETSILCAHILGSGPASSLTRHWLGTIAAGSALVSLAHFESDGGYARDWVNTSARQVGDRFILNGRKAPVFHATSADLLIVSAKLPGDDRYSLFVVDRESPGVRLHSARAVDGTPIGDITFENVWIDAERLLPVADPVELLDSAMNRATLAACACSLGAMSEALQMTLDHVKSRHQFRHTLSTFQTVRHRLVDMHIALAEASALTMMAIDAAEHRLSVLAVSSAKIKVNRAAKLIGDQSIQLHGGMGMTEALPLGRYYKHLLAAAGSFGDTDWHLDRLSAFS